MFELQAIAKQIRSEINDRLAHSAVTQVTPMITENIEGVFKEQEIDNELPVADQQAVEASDSADNKNEDEAI